MCTSNYDIGLIGPTSEELTASYNHYINDLFERPSEQVLDTNIYGYSLEYSMPELFAGISEFFVDLIPYLDLKPPYQMHELASAYFKMRYHTKNLFLLVIVLCVPQFDHLTVKSFKQVLARFMTATIQFVSFSSSMLTSMAVEHYLISI